MERGPTLYLDGVVRWRMGDLALWLRDEFRASVSEQTLSREVRATDYRKLALRRSKQESSSFHDIEGGDATFKRQSWKAIVCQSLTSACLRVASIASAGGRVRRSDCRESQRA